MSLSRTPSLPTCTQCMRSFAFGYLKETKAALGSFQHVRGKKKSTRGPLTMPVRLIKDLPGWGAKGTIVPVAAGRMRNEWYCQRIADYLTEPERRALKRSGDTIERDYAFMRDSQEQNANTEDEVSADSQPRPKSIQSRGITPERSMELLEIFVPMTLQFYRQEIAVPEPTKPKPTNTDSTPPSSSGGGGGAAADLMAARAKMAADAREAAQRAKLEAERQSGRAIYGSVSISDVLAAINQELSRNDEASKVVLDEGNISFTSKSSEGDATKLKETGTFGYTIQTKGTTTPIIRHVRVIGQSAKNSTDAVFISSIEGKPGAESAQAVL